MAELHYSPEGEATRSSSCDRRSTSEHGEDLPTGPDWECRFDRSDYAGMTTANVALLEALGDCLESGDTLFQALGKIEAAGGAAGSRTEGVRRAEGP